MNIMNEAFISFPIFPSYMAAMNILVYTSLHWPESLCYTDPAASKDHGVGTLECLVDAKQLLKTGYSPFHSAQQCLANSSNC